MKKSEGNKDSVREAMKNLREKRKEFIANASSKMKAQKKDMKAIVNFLQDRSATIPDISDGTGIPTSETLWYIATMKKYGQITEGEKKGAFFNYSLNLSEKNMEKEEV